MSVRNSYVIECIVTSLCHFTNALCVDQGCLSYSRVRSLPFCPTDRPKSVHNRCAIDVFGDVFYAVTLLFGFFCRCRGFCHMTESDSFRFSCISQQCIDLRRTQASHMKQQITICIKHFVFIYHPYNKRNVKYINVLLTKTVSLPSTIIVMRSNVNIFIYRFFKWKSIWVIKSNCLLNKWLLLIDTGHCCEYD